MQWTGLNGVLSLDQHILSSLTRYQAVTANPTSQRVWITRCMAPHSLRRDLVADNEAAVRCQSGSLNCAFNNKQYEMGEGVPLGLSFARVTKFYCRP